MRFPVRDGPPPLPVTLSYRELYEHGAFAQRDLETDSKLASMSKDRALAHWIGQEVPEADDLRGALCPILFASGGYTGHSSPPHELERLVFREDAGPRPWSDYAWDAWGYPQVSPMYSPWQLLYIDVVAREDGVEMPIDLLLGPVDERERQLSLIRPLIERQRGLFDAIDATWRPLIKLLVAIQNVYWPKVRTWFTITLAPGDEHSPAGNTTEAPEALLARVGCTIEEVTTAYQFLVERGLDREPEDEGMVTLRRFIHPDYHARWRGPVRHAQDHFNAAQMLYLWLTDLTGEPPGRPESWPADGRQTQRFSLYDNGFALHAMTDALKRELIDNELYPHGPAVIGEGPSERIIIDWLVQHLLLGPHSAIEFHELTGSGEAKRVPRLVEILDRYAADAFLIVDNEGDMARYVKKAVADGMLQQENVLLAEDSLEQSNFTSAELIEVASDIAAHPPDGREAAKLQLTAEELEDEHSERRSRIRRDKPGLADTMLLMAAWEEHGSVRVSKPELAEGLARLLITELRQASNGADIEMLKERREIVRFVIERICPVLSRPRPRT